MKIEKEITVLVTTTYEELDKELTFKGFSIKEKYNTIDKYMISKDVDLAELEKLEILKKCILVREIENIKKVLLYKHKEYNSKGEILRQGKIECPIEDISKAIKFMEAINYKELFTIFDKCISYSNGEYELLVQLVNDKYIFMEMEDQGEIEDMIRLLDSYDLPYSTDSYFVKKAEIMLGEVLNEN